MPPRLATVDISPLFSVNATPQSRVECRTALHCALRDTGFAVLRGAGVAPQILATMREAVKAVFDAPRNQYRDWVVKKDNYRGYVPLAYFTPNAGGAWRGDCWPAGVQSRGAPRLILQWAYSCAGETHRGQAKFNGGRC
jgi:isopenicillin N synthase-like dioxygenase